MTEKKFVCPKCGSEMVYFKTININPKPEGVIGLSMYDLIAIYRCRKCGYKSSEENLKLDGIFKDLKGLRETIDRRNDNVRYQDSHRDFEGVDYSEEDLQ